MIKEYDIKVRSNFSHNYYEGFIVDTNTNTVYFKQCDARRNGQVARYMLVRVGTDGNVTIRAYSAEEGRKEVFKKTQCLKLALRLLEEARSEAQQIASVAEAQKKANKGVTFDTVTVIVLSTLFTLNIIFGIVLAIQDSLEAIPCIGIGVLSMTLLIQAIRKCSKY